MKEYLEISGVLKISPVMFERPGKLRINKKVKKKKKI
jgi:hypothetical protein